VKTTAGQPRTLSPRAADAVCLALLLAVVTLLLWPLVFAGRAPLPDYLGWFAPWSGQTVHTAWNPLWYDSLGQYWPWRCLLHTGWGRGELPLWNPYQFGGCPLAANGQSALFYPPNWLCFGLLPVALGFRLTAAGHLWWAAAGAWWLARQLRCRRAAALVAGLCFGLSGFLVTWLTLPTLISSAAWLPWAVGCVERARATGRVRWGVASGACLGLSALAGHPQIFYYVALATGAVGLARLLPRRWPALLGCGVAAALTAAPALLPVLELAPHGHRPVQRGEQAYDGFMGRAIPADRLVTLLLPDFFGRPDRGSVDFGLESSQALRQAAAGSYWGVDRRGTQSPGDYTEFNLFVGVLPLALALLAWLRPGPARLYGGLGLLALALAFGSSLNAPLFAHLPGYAAGAGPCRLALLWSFGLAVSAALGLDAALRRVPSRAQLLVLAAPLLLLVVAWTGSSFLVARAGQEPLLDATQLRHLEAALALVLGLAAAAVALRRAPRLALVIVAAELLWAGWGFTPTCPAASLDPAPIRAWLASQGVNPSADRFVVLDHPSRWRFGRTPAGLDLPPNLATAAGVHDAGGYDSLLLAGSKQMLFECAGGKPISPLINGNMLLLGNLRQAPPGVTQVIGGQIPDGGSRTGIPPLVDDFNRLAQRCAEGPLALWDTAYPGWRLYGADGRRLSWGGRLGRGRLADLGRSEIVRWVFEPGSVKLGLFAGLLGLALLVAVALA
jgi:hypothetical protein